MKKIVNKDKKEKRDKSGGLILSETDILILLILYKVWWAFDTHLALLLDEPISYVKARLKQLCKAGLIGRKDIVSGAHSCNYLTAKGMRAIDKTPRHVRIPNTTSYWHDLGEIDMYIVLVLEHKGKHYAYFGDIITERDLLVLVPKIIIGKSSNGKAVYKDASRVHIPDGYLDVSIGKIALEYERTLKSRTSTTRTEDNYSSNKMRFNTQFWFCEKRSIMNKIDDVKGNDHTSIVPMDLVREVIKGFIKMLPTDRSTKSGRIRKDNIGEFKRPVAIDKLPIITDQKVILES